MLQDKKFRKAIEAFEFAISEDPKNGNLYDSLGQAHFENNNFTLAKLNYEKSLELSTDSKNAVKYLAEIEKKLKEN